MLTKLLPDPRFGVNPAFAKLTFRSGGICEGKGSTWPAVSYGCEKIGSAAFAGMSEGSKVKSVPPAQGASSVAQSDIQPLSVSKNNPPPPRILVFPSPKGSHAIPTRGERFLWSGKYQPRGAPGSPGTRNPSGAPGNLTDCLPGTMLKVYPWVSVSGLVYS